MFDAILDAAPTLGAQFKLPRPAKRYGGDGDSLAVTSVVLAVVVVVKVVIAAAVTLRAILRVRHSYSQNMTGILRWMIVVAIPVITMGPATS